MRRIAFFSKLSVSITMFAISHCSSYTLDEKICKANGCTGNTVGNSGGGPTPAPAIPINRVYLFPTLTQVDGNFGGRPGADALCMAARMATTFPENQCANVRAFLSLSASDEIVDLATNYGMPTVLPFNTPNNTLLANNQADLLDGTINSTLAAAGITLTAAGWHSFSGVGTANGTLDGAANCSGGTSNVANGRYGLDNSTGTSWMSLTQAVCSTRHLLCVCF